MCYTPFHMITIYESSYYFISNSNESWKLATDIYRTVLYCILTIICYLRHLRTSLMNLLGYEFIYTKTASNL